jgi:hypothetical protein
MNRRILNPAQGLESGRDGGEVRWRGGKGHDVYTFYFLFQEQIKGIIIIIKRLGTLSQRLGTLSQRLKSEVRYLNK